MKPISRLRFDALAGYIREPNLTVLFAELAWYEEGEETLLGLVALDRTDRDYGALVLARDARMKFRAVDLKTSMATPVEATSWLREKLADLVEKPAAFHYQGDEEGPPVDFFDPIVPVEKRAYEFEILRTDKTYTPALGLLRELMHYYEDPDGNFIQQFQSTGFDARIWEVYLYAAFTEMGYGFDRIHPAPDFHCVGPRGNFFVEATTLGVSPKTPKLTHENEDAYFDNYVPIRFSSALCAKLEKRYWELPHVAGAPLVLAIQDFHAPGAMTWTAEVLAGYLYGYHLVERSGEIVSERVDKHRWESKEIPSNFFGLPGSENISAVIANPSGTLSKFKRMGFLTGFGDRNLNILRRGMAFQGQPEATFFEVEVTSGDYTEAWCEGLAVYHNPNAAIPLPEDAFPGAGEFTFADDWLLSKLPSFFPLGTQTITVGIKSNDAGDSSS